jgi:hypothetical protein
MPRRDASCAPTASPRSRKPSHSRCARSRARPPRPDRSARGVEPARDPPPATLARRLGALAAVRTPTFLDLAARAARAVLRECGAAALPPLGDELIIGAVVAGLPGRLLRPGARDAGLPRGAPRVDPRPEGRGMDARGPARAGARGASAGGCPAQDRGLRVPLRGVRARAARPTPLRPVRPARARGGAGGGRRGPATGGGTLPRLRLLRSDRAAVAAARVALPGVRDGRLRPRRGRSLVRLRRPLPATAREGWIPGGAGARARARRRLARRGGGAGRASRVRFADRAPFERSRSRRAGGSAGPPRRLPLERDRAAERGARVRETAFLSAPHEEREGGGDRRALSRWARDGRALFRDGGARAAPRAPPHDPFVARCAARASPASPRPASRSANPPRRALSRRWLAIPWPTGGAGT